MIQLNLDEAEYNRMLLLFQLGSLVRSGVDNDPLVDMAEGEILSNICKQGHEAGAKKCAATHP